MEHFNLENNKFETDELELVDDAMNNAYNIFTGKTSYESLFFEGSDRIPLPFNPFSRNLDCKEIIDLNTLSGGGEYDQSFIFKKFKKIHTLYWQTESHLKGTKKQVVK